MKTRMALIGCGNLGYPLAHCLGQLGVDELHVHDLDREKAAKLKRDMAESCPSLRIKDQLGTDGFDLVVLSLSGPATAAFVTDPRNHTLFRGPRVFVSLGRPNYDDPAAHEALDRYLVEHGICLLFGFGLEPGLVEVLMHHLASLHKAGDLVSLGAVCGGVPQHPNPPLNYDLLFGNRLPAQNRRAMFKVDGELGHCLRFDMKEGRFVEGVGMLEVYHDGLSPYLLAAPPIVAIPCVRQQTARWPGFFDCMRVLVSLGLLDEQAVAGGTAAPSDMVHAILRRNGHLASHRPDLSFVEVVAQLKSGERSLISVVSAFDERTGLTGMAQLTSFTAAWAARQLLELATPCKPGLVLSHEFFDHGKTGALLDTLQTHLRCTVKISFAKP